MPVTSLFTDIAENAPFLICSAAFVSIQKEKCSIFKDQSLENGLSYMFQALGNIVNSQLKQQNTKVKIKKKQFFYAFYSLFYYTELNLFFTLQCVFHETKRKRNYIPMPYVVGDLWE